MSYTLKNAYHAFGFMLTIDHIAYSDQDDAHSSPCVHNARRPARPPRFTRASGVRSCGVLAEALSGRWLVPRCRRGGAALPTLADEAVDRPFRSRTCCCSSRISLRRRRICETSSSVHARDRCACGASRHPVVTPAASSCSVCTPSLLWVQTLGAPVGEGVKCGRRGGALTGEPIDA